MISTALGTQYHNGVVSIAQHMSSASFCYLHVWGPSLALLLLLLAPCVALLLREKEGGGRVKGEGRSLDNCPTLSGVVERDAFECHALEEL